MSFAVWGALLVLGVFTIYLAVNPKLIDDWRSAWRLHSVQINGYLMILVSGFLILPKDDQAEVLNTLAKLLPGDGSYTGPGVLVICVLVLQSWARLKSQK